MNRSILIVICDFLLVSLLAFSNLDASKLTDFSGDKTIKMETAVHQAESQQDLGNVMRLALEDERKKQDALVAELVNTREAAARQKAALSEREKQITLYQQEIKSRDQQTAQLQEQQKKLEQQYNSAQTNIQDLSQNLQRTSVEAVVSKEKLAVMEAEVKKKKDEAAKLQKQISDLAHSNQLATAERQQLATQIQLAENEKRHAAEQAAFMREEVKHERAEKSKLADGVKYLAQEIHESRLLSPNTIFSDFVTNRVVLKFNATRSTLLGIDSNRNKDAQTFLVTDGMQTYAVCHVQDTPLILWNPGIDWESLTGNLSVTSTSFPITTLSFHQQDPRVVFIPITNEQAQKLHRKVYKPATDPYKFQTAVVVGGSEGYYGECNFQMDLSTPQYLKMDHNSIKGLFGKFNPSKGDLVFSKGGDLLGIMVNNSYCFVLRNFPPMATFYLGLNMASQKTGDSLSRMGAFIQGLPQKLQ